MKRIVVIGILALTGLFACRPFTGIRSGSADKASSTEIVFGTFSAQKVSDKICQIKPVEFLTVPGILKDHAPASFLFPVTVTLEDAAHNTIKGFTIEHPLIEDFEFTDDQGRLGHMTRTKDSARIYLRFNADNSIKFIRFSSSHVSVPQINSMISFGN